MSDPASTTPTSQNTASRQTSGDPSSSALTPQYEERLIILAQGKQFQNSQLSDATYAIPDYLQSRIPSMVVTDDRNMTYSSDAQHVNFTIRRVTTKSDLITAMTTDGAHVVYCGHARFGQGPCFGDTVDPGEEWGSKSTDATQTGVFRAGFPYIGLPIDEICDEHQYTVSPVSGSNDKPAASDCHPHARQLYGSMQQFSVSDYAQKCQASSDQVATFLGNAGSSDTFWGYDGTGESGKFERHVLCACDWQNTDITPNDIGAVNMTCKAFICIACSTFVHHYPVVRQLKGWTHSGDSNYAYWTTRVTYSSVMTARWLYRILTYPQRNDNQAWQASLEWAKTMANQDYAGLSDKPSNLI
jgi:hypothetical protein